MQLDALVYDAVIHVILGQVATRITLTPSDATLRWGVGTTAQLEAVVYDVVDAIIPDAVVDWSSSDDAVAAVDAIGLVTAESNGTAQITAISGDASVTAAIEVMQEVSDVTTTAATATTACQAGSGGWVAFGDRQQPEPRGIVHTIGDG